MFRVEVEKVSGKILKTKPLPSQESAQEAAEKLWMQLSGDGETSRVSVIDQEGKRLTDLEC